MAISLPLDVAVSIVNDTDSLTVSPELVVPTLAAMSGRDRLACPTELVVTWHSVADHLRAQHHWLINARPPESLRPHGMVRVWAWLDHLAQRYGPTVQAAPLDPEEVPYCVRHNSFLH